MNKYLDLCIRYFIIILVAMPNLFLFYLILTPLTVYPVYFIFSLFFKTVLNGNIITIKNLEIELIKSCIAGSAYYFLFALNLSLPKIQLKKRIEMVLFAFITFMMINLVRIFILTFLVLSNSSAFEIVHKLSWYFLSIAIVISVWFAEVYLFKIKDIPFYTDLKFLYKKIKC